MPGRDPAVALDLYIRNNGVVKTDRELDGRTRDRVARLLMEQGPATAAALAQALGISPTAIRRHLDGLVAEEVIAERTVKPFGSRGRGRPARVFALTDSGRDGFPHAYDDMAVRALRFLSETGGPEAVAAFAKTRATEMTARYEAVVSTARTDTERSQALADTLTADGYAASTRIAPTGVQICQHHCPVAHVAHEFPQLCEAETEAFSELLGSHVQRLATIAHGDGVCTTYVPAIPTLAPSQQTGS